MKYLALIFLGITISNFSICQSNPQSARKDLENDVKNSDVVIEGQCIGGTKSFKTKDKIYTSTKVKVLKIFKGEISDSVIEIICDWGTVIDTLPDGKIVAEATSISDGGENLTEGSEGILLLNSNAKAKDNKDSYTFFNYLRYYKDKRGSSGYIAVSGKDHYVDVKKELFKKIESVTHIQRKVLGLNSFEIEEAKKTKK